jgi:hypothetical protein
VRSYVKSLLFGAVLFGVALGAGITQRATATEWQGRKLPNIPANFIFGYGSLINTASRNSSVTVPIPAIPVRVSAAFGYVRTWNDRSVSGFTALGLRKLSPGETGHTINGVLYPADGADMSSFDAREKGYVRVEVPISQIEAVGWQRLPEAGHVWTYIPALSVEHGGTDVPGQGLPAPDASFPILQSYIDVVVEGGLEYGPDFAREILETTDGWSRFWLNDRELARRPWVHDPRSDTVDALLIGTPASAAELSSRAFPEMYGAKLRAGSSQ